MLTIEPCALPDVKLIKPRLFEDDRGFVAESVSERRMAEHGIFGRFVQENLSFSKKRGTIRGLHFQKPPAAQAKLIRVLSGKIFDVAVDIRPASPTYGRHVSVVLDAGKAVSLFYVPRGFAHGFCTLTDNVMVEYKVDAYYAPDCEGGILWNDPHLNIDWPIDATRVILSEKDKTLPSFACLPPLEWL